MDAEQGAPSAPGRRCSVQNDLAERISRFNYESNTCAAVMALFPAHTTKVT